MYILGLNNNHNATAVLLKDGKIVDCVSEERFTNIKNYIGIPRKAIGYILKKNRLSPHDIDLICLGYKYGGPLLTSSEEKRRLGWKLLPLKAIFFIAEKIRFLFWGLEKYFPILRRVEEILYKFYVIGFSRKSVEQEKRLLAKFLKIPEEKIVGFEHHQAHATAAYFCSPFREKNVLALSLDAEGDLLCSTVGIYNEESNYRRVAATPIGHSLAQIYGDVTRYLGMKPNEHEYKVMGLAPYAKGEGKEKVFEKIKNWVVLDKDNPLVFRSKFHTRNTYSILKKEMEGFRFDNIAAGFQKLVEERVSEWVKQAIKKTGVKTLVLGGGIFMNVKLNQKISELKEVKEVFFMPSCGDESTSVGVAFLGYLKLCQEKRIKPKIVPIKNLYWGPSFSNKEIEKFLRKYQGRYKIKFLKNPAKTIAKLLAEGKIVAVLQGRMEWGARALGNRSILAHPARPELIRDLNEVVKNRDFWMPFAPSILAERADDYLVNPKHFSAPFMILAFDSTPLAKKELAAAMHPYDFTIRPQVVEKEANPRYYQIIKEFEKLTGIGGVLNTSFNLHGYPIVLGPREAIYVFENSGLEYLVLEDYLICKK